MNQTEINVNHSNENYKKLLKNDFGYTVTVYDEFDSDKVLKMLTFIDELAIQTSEIHSSDNDILNNLNNSIASHNVTQEHLEQLLKVLEWRNVVSDLWYSKNHDEEQKLRTEIKDI